jgi:hypothetical protein
MQVFRVRGVEPGVPRERPLGVAHATHEVVKRTEQVDQRSPQDHAFVRRRAYLVDDGDGVVALEHAQVLVPKQVVERSPVLRDYGRRHFLQHDELRMAVGEARAREPAFVDQGMDVGESFGSRGVDAVLPGFRDRFDLALAEIGEGADVLRRVDDDFLALERRVEVRDDPNPPGVPDP